MGSGLAVTLSMNFGFNLALAIGCLISLGGLVLFPASESAKDAPASEAPSICGSTT
jgi:hypothetical protein